MGGFSSTADNEQTNGWRLTICFKVTGISKSLEKKEGENNTKGELFRQQWAILLFNMAESSLEQ